MAANGLAALIQSTQVLAQNDFMTFEQMRNHPFNNQHDIKLDSKNKFLHIIITTNEDIASTASVQTVVEMNLLMKKLCSDFKTACLMYMSKGNTTLETQMNSIIISS